VRARNAPAFSAYDLSSQVGLFLTDFRGALGPAVVGAAAQLTGLYNQGLQQALAQLQVLAQAHFVHFDVDGLVQQIIADPAPFGLDDVVDACLAFFTTVDPICARPRRHLFWDGIHPTVAGHEIPEHAAQRLLVHEVKTLEAPTGK
jgi:outer membrane lipase/esterase